MKTNQEKIAEISARIETIIDCCATTPNNFAKVLGYGRAQTIYDIINRKCAPSYDFFNRFTDSEYSAIINLRWLLNGEGEMWTDFMLKLTHENKLEVVQDVNHGISVSNWQVDNSMEKALMEVAITEKAFLKEQYRKQESSLSKLTQENGKLKERIAQAKKYYDTILEQAEEIGKLKERISQLELQLQKNVSDASTGDIASAG